MHAAPLVWVLLTSLVLHRSIAEFHDDIMILANEINTSDSLHKSYIDARNAPLPTFLTLKASPTDDPADSSEDCTTNKTWNTAEICSYVKSNADNCEGGGYLKWTQYVECQQKSSSRILVIVAGVFFMLILFVMISSAADDFFSPNVAVIVSHLRISESVAGVTFMAFGNGAPDVFGAVASVLSSPIPKAGLALGELLGAGIFVTLMVTATIVLTKPFKVEVYTTVRDLCFYLVALGWILFVFLYATQVYIWEPAVYLVIYACYVGTVIFIRKLQKKQRQRNHSKRASTFRSIKRSSHRVTMSDVHTVSEVVKGIEKQMQNAERIRGSLYNDKPMEVIPEDDNTNTITEASEMDSESEEDFIVTHNHVFHGPNAQSQSRAASIVPAPIKVTSYRTFFLDIYLHLKPLSDVEWEDANIIGKIFDVIKILPVIVFKLTIPVAENSWSKSIAIVHAIIAPQFFLFSIQEYVYRIGGWGPGLYAYAAVLSVILVVLLAVFTTFDSEPKYYRSLCSLAGFLMSISWIYIIANEVVDVVTMLGVVLRLSHEILGLTVLAWSNSIGDLIADVAVAKQGFSKMAMAAAIAGPLFNLLIGFGVPFFIAKIQGKKVLINLTPIYKVLILFLGISLLTTLIGIFVQKFYLRRPYAFLLITIYVIFLTMAILVETKVINWN